MHLKALFILNNNIVFTYAYHSREDLNGALQIVEEAKANNLYPTSKGCIHLAKVCAKTAPEKLDEGMYSLTKVYTFESNYRVHTLLNCPTLRIINTYNQPNKSNSSVVKKYRLRNEW